jgi:hypothetical protein
VTLPRLPSLHLYWKIGENGDPIRSSL